MDKGPGKAKTQKSDACFANEVKYQHINVNHIARKSLSVYQIITDYQMLEANQQPIVELQQVLN